MVKNLPVMRCERPGFHPRVRSLGQEDPLEKGKAIRSSILAHGQRSLADYSPWDRKQLDMTERLTHTHTHTQCVHRDSLGFQTSLVVIKQKRIEII